ncbi:MAG: PEP-CTERM sorting domain-containing protein [Pirellulaceae bacterium]|nr:PEP-CTERM sorting domain-containing protein [Pirellulaceae bacterium]
MKNVHATRVFPLVAVGLLLAITNLTPLQAQGPVLRWDFDEENGPALDSGTGISADGVLQSTAARTTNTPGSFSAFALDLSAEGFESWVNGGEPEKVDTLTQFTLTTWLYLEDLNAENGGSGNVRLLAKQAANANYDGISWNLNNPNEGDRSIDNFKLGLFIGGEEGFGFAQSSEDLSADNAWTFLAVSYDGSADEDNLFFYVGDEDSIVEQLGFEQSVFAGQVESTEGEAVVAIGYTDAAPGNDFSAVGFQDDVRIYDRVLDVDELELVRLENLQSTIRGDFDNDGALTATDMNLLTDEVRANSNQLPFDLNDDQLVDQLDRIVWIESLKNSYFGDANLDLEFNSTDFVGVFQAGEYEDQIADNSGWSTGDWNGDGEFDSSDFVTAFQGGGFEQGKRPAAAIPEPSSIGLLMLACLVITVWRR